VRRVGHELALRAGGAVERGLRGPQRVEHAVELRGQFTDLVRAARPDAAVEVLGLGDVVRGGGHLADRADEPAADQAPEPGRETDAGEADGRQHQPQAAQDRVHPVHRPPELERAPRGRDGEHAQVRPVDPCARQVLARPAARERSHPRIDRQPHPAGAEHARRAAGRDDLGVRDRPAAARRRRGQPPRRPLRQPPGDHEARLGGEGAVDVVAQGVVHGDVGRGRRQRDRDQDRERGQQRDEPAQRHGSRSA
jgi:hypothetical protein